jgi:uncharacterized OB-fold protein
MTSQNPQRPLPQPQPESDFYWEKAAAHELWLRRCKDCTRAYFYPRDICPHCYSRNVEWVQASGRGTLYAFSVVERGPVPFFRDRVPYIAALVELEEGPRLPTNLVGVEPDAVSIGMPVRVDFEDTGEGVTLPVFRPA